jgi:hypothetical protein
MVFLFSLLGVVCASGSQRHDMFVCDCCRFLCVGALVRWCVFCFDLSHPSHAQLALFSSFSDMFVVGGGGQGARPMTYARRPDSLNVTRRLGCHPQSPLCVFRSDDFGALSLAFPNTHARRQ